MHSISNISELSESLSEVKVLDYNEEAERINKIKYNLGLLYFAALSIMMTTLFL